MQKLARILLSFVIAFTLVHVPLTQQAQAGMLTTSQVVNEMSRAQGEQSVAKFLDRSDVKDQLVALGVNPDDATKRISKLSDKEVNKLAMNIQQYQAGGDAVGILLIVLLVIAIIYFAKRI